MMAAMKQPEKEILAFAENLFRFLMEKYSPDCLPPSKPKWSQHYNVKIGKATSLLYQFTKDDMKLVCRKTYPSGNKMEDFCDWIHDTFLEKYVHPNVFVTVFSSASFVFEVALFAKSRDEPKHYYCVADLWCYLFDRTFAREFFARGGWEGLKLEAIPNAFLYDSLLEIHPDGKLNIDLLYQNVMALIVGRGSTSDGPKMVAEASGACGFSEAGGSYGQKGAVTSSSPKKGSKKESRRTKEKPLHALGKDISMIETPPELVREGFPPQVHPEAQKRYAWWIQQYGKGNMSKREVIREFSDLHRVPVMVSELQTIDIKHLPGERDDTLDKLYSDEVTFPKIKNKSPRKSKAESTVSDLTSGIEQLRMSSKSPSKVKSAKDKTESVADVASVEKSEDENSDSGSEESCEEGEQQQSPSKKKGKKKKKSKGGKKRKKK